jgi:hypothetical protein
MHRLASCVATALAGLTIVVPHSALPQGAPAPSAAEIHAGVVHRLRAATPSLPPGDTLVTWAGHATFTHTASFAAETSRAGLLSSEGPLALATIAWAGTRPRGFVVQWVRPGAPAQVVRGTVQAGALHLTGSRTRRAVVPALPWAVADVGMEELLVPALRGPGFRIPQRLAVFRPATLRWDTLVVVVSTRRGGQVVQLRGTRGCEWLALGVDGRLLWSRPSGQPGEERRPLDTTRRSAEYLRRRAALRGLPTCPPAG